MVATERELKIVANAIAIVKSGPEVGVSDEDWCLSIVAAGDLAHALRYHPPLTQEQIEMLAIAAVRFRTLEGITKQVVNP